MSYAIVFSSRTGNTALLAQTIRDTLPGDCLYFGTPDPKALEAETVYVGFWTDKGSCDESISQFLKTLTNQKVFLFGTAGFGGSPEYFEQILKRVSENLGDRYEAMEESPRRTAMLQNFDQAVSHPDQQDLENLKTALTK